MNNPTLKETYISRQYEPGKVVARYVRFDDAPIDGTVPRRSFKFYEVNAKSQTIREYYSDGRELDTQTAKAAKDAKGAFVKWDAQS